MADIELVINVPEKLICEGFERPFTEEERNILIKAIGNGTPLPKGHGRLIDADALKETFIEPGIYLKYTEKGFWCVTSKKIKDAPTIIEADKNE